MRPYRIVLADDHLLLRQGLRKILYEQPGLEVAGEAGDGLELLRLLRTVSADMIILDISMPNLRGIEAAREIKSIDPHLKVLMLTMHNNSEYLRHAIASGADGYLLKEDADKELFSAIETVRRGELYVSPILSQGLPGNWAKMLRGEAKLHPEGLTNREREILKLIGEGKSSKEIGELLFISARTVDRHRANVMDKLDVKKTAELVKYAFQNGYL
jgi:DNA-binding NarL/FixJ family response regulator